MRVAMYSPKDRWETAKRPPKTRWPKTHLPTTLRHPQDAINEVILKKGWLRAFPWVVFQTVFEPGAKQSQTRTWDPLCACAAKLILLPCLTCVHVLRTSSYSLVWQACTCCGQLKLSVIRSYMRTCQRNPRFPFPCRIRFSSTRVLRCTVL